MTVRVFEDEGAAELNKANQVGRIESIGPITVVANHLSDSSNVVMAFEIEKTGAKVYSDQDTVQAAEATGFVGNDVLLDFTGQSLNVTPIVPGSVVLHPATTGVDLRDGGDGKFYTVDVDAEEAGVIDYFTGAMTLAYPATKQPDGAISADYYSQAEAVVPHGRKSYVISNSGIDDNLIVKAASDSSLGARVRIDGVATWL